MSEKRCGTERLERESKCGAERRETHKMSVTEPGSSPRAVSVRGRYQSEPCDTKMSVIKLPFGITELPLGNMELALGNIELPLGIRPRALDPRDSSLVSSLHGSVAEPNMCHGAHPPPSTPHLCGPRELQ